MAVDVNEVGGVDMDDGELMLPKGTEVLQNCWRPISPEWLDAKAEPPPRRYLLRCPDEGNGNTPGFLPRGRVGMLVAEGAGGKSWAAIELALSVASGVPWFATYTVDEPGRVLLALGEEEESEIHRRLWHAARAMGLTQEQRRLAVERIVVMPLSGVPVRLTDSGAVESETFEENRNTTALHMLLRQGTEPWALLIFDPVSRFAGSDAETDNAAATRFIQTLERFTETRGNPAVLAAHHTNKVARSDGAKASAAAARGSSAFTDGARWVAQLSPNEEGGKVMGMDMVDLVVTKTNYGWRPPPLHLQRERKFEGALVALTEDEVAKLNKRLAEATGNNNGGGNVSSKKRSKAVPFDVDAHT